MDIVSLNKPELNHNWTLFLTPKAYSDHRILIAELAEKGVQIAVTHWIYINMQDPTWTREDCDSTGYLVETKT